MGNRANEVAGTDHAGLVGGFGTRQESQAMGGGGLLESAGIRALVAGLDAPQDVLPGVGGVTVRVVPQAAAEARRLIQEYRATGPEPVDDGPDSDAGPFNEGSAA